MESPYLRQRREAKLKQTTTLKAAQRAEKADLNVFYKTMIEQAPTKCENCDANLQDTLNFIPKAIVAHIVAKGRHGCPSVATHPMNKWYACMDCHTFYDTQPADEVAKMRVIPTLVKRVKLFFNKIADNEKRRVPEYLLEKNK